MGYSHLLHRYVRDAGGTFIEMPVSGSKGPAQRGELVGMLAGEQDSGESVKSVVEPITAAFIYCGSIVSGFKIKYATKLYLITMTVGLAEAMKLAHAQNLDLEAFGEVLAAGPMASAYMKNKVEKILNQDWSPQAAIRDCYNSTELIRAAAGSVNLDLPVARAVGMLYKQATDAGLGQEDMIAVGKVG